MTEVLFADSEAVAMKAAKSTVIYSKIDGPTAVFLAGKKTLPEKEHCGWIPGTADEVVCLCYWLDMGDIRQEAESRYRKDFIFSLCSQESSLAEMQEYADDYMQMKRLKACLESGEAIRIWYSDAPYSRCGLYHLCHLLNQYENEVHAVELPEYVVHGKAFTVYNNWGEVAAEEFAGFLPKEKIFSKEEIRMYAFLWNELTEDNSPLRAMVNGRMMGVPESFYDFMIWGKITKKPIRECRLIGDILGYNRASVRDWWYAKRIQHFIETGKVKVLEDSEKPYARVICLA